MSGARTIWVVNRIFENTATNSSSEARLASSAAAFAQAGPSLLGTFEAWEAYKNTDWSQFEHLPLFRVANRMNAYNTYLLMEQAGAASEDADK